ncbi:hypothetical protein [Domibacillus tundrae]|uniref:hypothetical protein n=1 Tax=Domibacillus tundrae TaxID=1587527 RepID=UPI000617D79F|nr:hypothetical protein [Domibacillus tundrae]
MLEEALHYIAKKPRKGEAGYHVLTFEGTQEEFLELFEEITLPAYGCYTFNIVHIKKTNMYLDGLKRKGRKKEFRVTIKDV